MHSELNSVAEQQWQKLIDRYPEHETLLDYEPRLKAIFSLSDFISESCLRDITIVDQLLVQNKLEEPAIDYVSELASACSEVTDEAQLHQALRQFRRLWMTHLAWRDLLNMQPIKHSLQQVSALADALINQAYQWLYPFMCEKHGTPMGSQGAQPLFVLGMGKLGGKELNFSSDIDLIFVYPETGTSQGGRKPLEHQLWFQRLGQKLIAALHQTTIDGQVFRVDMRLRPFGESGPLVCHMAAFEDYYQQQGRDWERYAMVKARIINPDGVYSEQVEDILRPFVYRRYLDFSAIESLRKMKLMIQQEVRRRQLADNIKLGSGGIREIEFIVQSLQLIRAGRQTPLQQRSIFSAFSALESLQILSAEEVEELRNSYLFLRKTEHCLQQFADQQTQTLPDAERDKWRLAIVMGFANYGEFYQQLQQRLVAVSTQFSSIIGDSQQAPQTEQEHALEEVWTLSLSEQEAAELLQNWLNTEQVSQIWPHWQSFRDYLQHHPMGQRGRETLDKLMPILFCQVLNSDTDTATTLQRLYSVLRSICRRTTYLELLLENEAALSHLIRLCAASPWVAELIARYPVLLDELLHPDSLYHPAPVDGYEDELRQYLMRVDPQDLELQMESLRQFKLSQQLKIAASDISGALPVMKVSDHLTFLAEAILSQAVNMAWQQMVERYGYPRGADDANRRFAVVGYGKLGGLELGFGSDLDLVLLHGCDDNGDTSGPKQIESRQFYLRLAQRLMHIFSTKTASGELYEIDLRLRPSGNSGLLVCHVDTFEQYQQEEAWTWEHQALTRSRFILGDEFLQQRFSQIRHQILCSQRDKQALNQEVAQMRDKMLDHLSKGSEQLFDLKQDRGGIADIEFIVQYLVLANAEQFPQLTKWSDNVRILQTLLDVGVIDETQATLLTEAYLGYRNYGHKLALQQQPLLVEQSEFDEIRQKVIAQWQQCFAN